METLLSPQHKLLQFPSLYPSNPRTLVGHAPSTTQELVFDPKLVETAALLSHRGECMVSGHPPPLQFSPWPHSIPPHPPTVSQPCFPRPLTPFFWDKQDPESTPCYPVHWLTVSQRAGESSRTHKTSKWTCRGCKCCDKSHFQPTLQS